MFLLRNREVMGSITGLEDGVSFKKDKIIKDYYK
jgi:hypothetical protein